jgi:soluble lytic murein transglycosylase-like protein
MIRRFQFAGEAAAICLCALAALPCLAANSAVLRNGFSIRYERKQDMGFITRLYVGADESSFVDVPTGEIDHIETVPDDTNARATQRPAPGATPVSQQPLNIDEFVTSASGAYRLDPDLVNSVIRAESGFNVRAVSPKGAQGLMQLMPQTASLLGVQNTFDAQANVEGGTRYLRELLERYNFDLIKALAAYNAGPERVQQYSGVPPYYETKAYVARVIRDYNNRKLVEKNGTRPVDRGKPLKAKTTLSTVKENPKTAAAKPQASPENNIPASH